MATTREMFAALLALIINTFAILCMYFVGNVVMAPIVTWAGNQSTNQTMGYGLMNPGEMTYIFPAIFGLLLIFEIIIIIIFVATLARRNVVDDFY